MKVSQLLVSKTSPSLKLVLRCTPSDNICTCDAVSPVVDLMFSMSRTYVVKKLHRFTFFIFLHKDFDIFYVVSGRIAKKSPSWRLFCAGSTEHNSFLVSETLCANRSTSI
jgi:hypothetical protein